MSCYFLTCRLQSKYGHVFDIHPRVFVMDANACGSPDLKALKAAVAEMKASIVEVRLVARALFIALSYLILRSAYCVGSLHSSYIELPSLPVILVVQ